MIDDGAFGIHATHTGTGIATFLIVAGFALRTVGVCCALWPTRWRTTNIT